MAETVLLTGALGKVGKAILSHLSEDYIWRLLDICEPDKDFQHKVIVTDILDAESVKKAVSGVDTIIHLAGDPNSSAPWQSVLRNNIEGTQILFEAAVEEGVNKFIFASSNHAVGHYEKNLEPSNDIPNISFELDGAEPPRPGNFYGVSKAVGELLGRFYHDEYGISVICVRIGNLNDDGPPKNYSRGQSMWLSNRDCAHLFDQCIKSNYGYEIIYGISDNDSKYYSIERARDVLDYNPLDNSADHIS